MRGECPLNVDTIGITLMCPAHWRGVLILGSVEYLYVLGVIEVHSVKELCLSVGLVTLSSLKALAYHIVLVKIICKLPMGSSDWSVVILLQIFADITGGRAAVFNQ